MVIVDETSRYAERLKACTADFAIVSMAASAGGLAAFIQVLRGLPADFPVPVAIVQHLAPHYRSMMPKILNRCTALKVRQASDGDVLVAGQIYIAPPNYHLLIEPAGTLRLCQFEPVHFVRPSAEWLFVSTAECYGEHAIAVVLTGSGKDGEQGVRVIKQHGGVVIAQDEASAEYFGMPGAAIATQCVDFVLPLDEIAPVLRHLVMKNKPNQEKQGE